MLSRTLLLSAAFSLASAANFDIQVGENGNSYTPATIAAQQGDTVTFHFTGSVHDVVQSTFDAPCTPKSGGIYAPIQSKAGETFTVTVQNTDPIWFYCSVPGHCNSGMVGVINAPTGQTQSSFADAAKGAQLSQPSGSASGGVLGNGSGSSSSGSSSSGSTNSASGASTTGTGSAGASSTAGAAASAFPAALALVAGAVAGLI